MAVLPANELVRPDKLAGILEADRVSLMPEVQFAGLFPDCEPGAEPPFGTLYGLPTVVDQALTTEPKILVRAGTHDEALEMGCNDYLAMEHPRIGAFGSRLVDHNGQELLVTPGRRPRPKPGLRAM